MARGWRRERPGDALDIAPMTDGGEGFGEIIGGLLRARARSVATVNAAHHPVVAQWWLAANELAVVESANVIGLALLEQGRFHPFQLDTFGLGNVLRAVERAGVKNCFFGIGGSATNDGGFGLARALGWKFFDRGGHELREWWQLIELKTVERPAVLPGVRIIVAVDVQNPLLGRTGCARVYGPQKGLRPEDFKHAEECLRRLSRVMRAQHEVDADGIPGAGAAGGLGFGLMAFAGARVESGFDIFARHAQLEKRLRAADLVLTGEGALDEQTRMGKGVGRLALWAGRHGKPCIGLAGMVSPALASSGMFAELHALTDIAPLERARRQAAACLTDLARKTARAWSATVID